MRSKSYPVLSLPDAITHARQLWDSKKRAAMTDDEAATVFGHQNAKSGPARRKVSALKQYGLLVKESGGWTLSGRAMTIMHKPEISPAHKNAIREAINDVPLFKELLKTRLSATGDALKSYLIVDEGFTDSGADAFVKSFVPTKSLVVESDAAYDSEADDSRQEETTVTPTATPAATTAPPAKTTPGGPNQATETSKLASDGAASISWPSDLSAEGYEDLEYWLNGVLRKAKRAMEAKRLRDAIQPHPADQGNSEDAED